MRGIRVRVWLLHAWLSSSNQRWRTLLSEKGRKVGKEAWCDHSSKHEWRFRIVLIRYWNNGVHYGTRFWFWYGLHHAFSRVKEQSEQASQRHGGKGYFWEIICWLLVALACNSSRGRSETYVYCRFFRVVS